MITRRQHSHLMPVNSIVIEEMSSLLVDLPRAVLIAPQVQQLLVHRIRSQFRDLAEVSEGREFSVCHAHVGLVRLHVGRCYRFELGSRGCVEEVM